LIAYAARTGTKRNLDALHTAGWRLLVSATGVLRHEGFRYALDNGAWTAFTHNQPFNEHKFMIALRKMGKQADWTVIPDIVAGGRRSLDFSLCWMHRVLAESPRALLAVQDGLTTKDVRPFLSTRVGIFIGGSTEWKLATMRTWGDLAQRVGCLCHVARVNTPRRIRLARAAGATSIDGSAATRWAKALPELVDALTAVVE
jgi:hypothetical protein